MLPKAQGAGYGASSLPLSALFTDDYLPDLARKGIPSVVYFYTTKDEAKFLKFEEAAFKDERLGVASRWFNFVKISLDHIPSAEDRKLYGGDAPAVLFLDAQGVVQKRLDGWKTDADDLLKLLDPTFRLHYGAPLGPFLTKLAKILDVLDRTHWSLEDLATDLKAAEEHLVSHDCDRGRREVKEIKDDSDKLRAERTKALEEEKKLLEGLKAPASGGAVGSG